MPGYTPKMSADKVGTVTRNMDAQKVQLTDEEIAFRLNFISTLDDEQTVSKLCRIIKSCNQDILDSVTALTAQVTSYKAALASRDATIQELREEVNELRVANDALDQYGRRANLRISGISESWEENTTEAIMDIANNVLKLDPPLQEADIDVSHRLSKPKSAAPEDPRPVIVRFMTRKDRCRMISRRSVLKAHHEGGGPKLYVNEDLTAYRAGLFSTARRMQKAKHFSQVWTYNGSIKVKSTQGVVHSIASYDDLGKLCPGVDITKFKQTKHNK